MMMMMMLGMGRSGDRDWGWRGLEEVGRWNFFYWVGLMDGWYVGR